MPAVVPANQDLFERIMRHELWLERKMAHEAAATHMLLLQVEADIIKRVEARLKKLKTNSATSSYDLTAARLDSNLTEVQELIEGFYVGYGKKLQASLIAQAHAEAAWAAGAVSATISAVGLNLGVGLAEGFLLDEIVLSNPFEGGLLREWVHNLSRMTLEGVRKSVRVGMLQGDSVDDIVRAVRRVSKIKRRDAEAVVRTAMSHVYNSARDLAWQANSDLVRGLVWVSTLDNRTTQPCRLRDGKIYNLDHSPRGHAIPWRGGPGRLHWRCRSTSTPLLATWQELGIDANELTGQQRAAMNGFVPASMTYSQWQQLQAA